jgi:hypothetical protein
MASLKPDIHHSSQQIHFLSITRTNFLMMLREITAIFYEHFMQHIAGAFVVYVSTSMPATLSTITHVNYAVKITIKSAQVPSGPATLRHQHSTHCSNQAKPSQAKEQQGCQLAPSAWSMSASPDLFNHSCI